MYFRIILRIVRRNNTPRIQTAYFNEIKLLAAFYRSEKICLTDAVRVAVLFPSSNSSRIPSSLISRTKENKQCFLDIDYKINRKKRYAHAMNRLGLKSYVDRYIFPYGYPSKIMLLNLFALIMNSAINHKWNANNWLLYDNVINYGLNI